MYVTRTKIKTFPSIKAYSYLFMFLGEMRNIILRSANLKFTFQIQAAEAIVMVKLLDITVTYYNNFISSNRFWNPVGNAYMNTDYF